MLDAALEGIRRDKAHVSPHAGGADKGLVHLNFGEIPLRLRALNGEVLSKENAADNDDRELGVAQREHGGKRICNDGQMLKVIQELCDLKSRAAGIQNDAVPLLNLTHRNLRNRLFGLRAQSAAGFKRKYQLALRDEVDLPVGPKNQPALGQRCQVLSNCRCGGIKHRDEMPYFNGTLLFDDMVDFTLTFGHVYHFCPTRSILKYLCIV